VRMLCTLGWSCVVVYGLLALSRVLLYLAHYYAMEVGGGSARLIFCAYARARVRACVCVRACARLCAGTVERYTCARVGMYRRVCACVGFGQERVGLLPNQG
jgi:hypothetical protein